MSEYRKCHFASQIQKILDEEAKAGRKLVSVKIGGLLTTKYEFGFEKSEDKYVYVHRSCDDVWHAQRVINIGEQKGFRLAFREYNGGLIELFFEKKVSK